MQENEHDDYLGMSTPAASHACRTEIPFGTVTDWSFTKTSIKWGGKAGGTGGTGGPGGGGDAAVLPRAADDDTGRTARDQS